MKRRTFLAASAAALAASRFARAATASVIRFTPEADLAVLDPVWTTSSQTQQHAYLVYDTLWGVDEQYRPQPQMLEGHVVEDDGKTWRLTLRDGLLFHDGSKVLGRDAAASLMRWAKRDTFGQALLAVTDEISAPDDRTVLIRLKYPFPVADAVGKSAGNMCAIMPERIAKTDAFTQIRDTVGSGPFRYKADETVNGAKVVYVRNDAYVPRPNGTTSGTAGPKIANFERVEWAILPDPTTSVGALQRGEIDWLLTPNADLIDSLRKDKGVVVRVNSPTGSISCMRFNQLQPPFDNPAIRRAFFPAIVQSDYMVAMNGEDRSRWNDNVGYFCPALPMANDAGMQALSGPRSIDDAKRALEKAGYKGEKVVLLGPADVPYAKILADVTADLYKRLGLNLEYQQMDWGTLVQRRAKTDPVDQGGWSVFQTNWTGPDQANPAVHVFLRGNGKDAAPGWPNSPRIEELRNTWLRTTALDKQREIAREIQAQAFVDVPYIPLGQMISPTAYRANLTGMIPGAVPVFWNIKRS
ncbi:MAG TPA: ABC transporter substrate-binding protein [Acetobacteraceae bacterium]|jgi:peptide/nickel transport system substrate-binding protein|nr:ABC transporter substrate-binding protein [Acetobacteraceae bacterium]